jgi:hypothetical protein
MNNRKQIIFLLSIVLLFSCKPDDHTHDAGELITTIKLSFKNSGKVFQYKLINGAVTADTIKIAKNTIDTINVSILDETKTPAMDLTAEILAEKNDHQFFYTSSAGLNLSTRYLDKDANDFPVGLTMEISASAVSQGNLTVVLKHQPDIKNGSSSVGSTDANVTFPVIIN